MTISTSDCRKFLVEQVKLGKISADWACDENAAADEIANAYQNEDDYHLPNETDNWTDEDWDREINLVIPALQVRVTKALTTESNWKRRAKYKVPDDGIKSIREFMCDTPDNLFDGQVGYRVIELSNGDLILGDYIGD